MPKLIRPRQPPIQKRNLSNASWEVLRQIDEILLDRERRDKLSYHFIRAKLNRVPRLERGIDWTERVVALYCCKGMRENRCAALKREINNERLRRQQPEKLEEFNGRLRKTLFPLMLTNHGLSLPFAHRDQKEVARDLVSLFSILEELGYQAMINSGTLLGAVREGEFLGHDDDADLAVLIDGKTDIEVVESLKRLLSDLNESGGLSEPAWFHKSVPMLKVLIRSGIEVDLFPLWFREERAYIWPHTYGELTWDDIFPLSNQKLCGAPMPSPKNVEKMLALNYGDNWQLPDPDYFFPWDDAKKRFESILNVYRNSQRSKSLLRSMKLSLRNFEK